MLEGFTQRSLQILVLCALSDTLIKDPISFLVVLLLENPELDAGMEPLDVAHENVGAVQNPQVVLLDDAVRKIVLL